MSAHVRRVLVLGALALGAAGCPGRQDPQIPRPNIEQGAGCDEVSATDTRACQITRRAQRIGGPAAIAEVGDYLLENDKIRIAILAPGNSVGPGLFGGSIVDADIQRPAPGSERGGDRFSEVFPLVNFAVPGDPVTSSNPALAPLQPGLGAMHVEALCPGAGCPDEYRRAGAAVVRVTAKGASLISALDALRLLAVQSDLSFRTDYVLEPHKTYVRMHTEVVNDGCGAAGVFDGAPETTTLDPIDPARNLFEVLLGDSLHIGGTDPVVRAPGFSGGDFLLFGPKVHVFAPGEGYGQGLYFKRAFERRVDIIRNPLSTSWVAGVAGDVSYGYFAGSGPVQVPIFTASFTATFVGQRGFDYLIDPTEPAGPHAGSECKIPEYMHDRFAYDRYFVVGDGDTGEIARARFEVTHEPFGTIAGRVVAPGTFTPISGADVLVLHDPGGSLPASVREAMDRNRAAGGDPGVLLALSTDRGLDHDRDGSFSGPVPPGSYLVVARFEGSPPSAPVRVNVTTNRTSEGTIALGVNGRLRFHVVDERGADSPAKITVLDADVDPSRGSCGPMGLHAPSRGTAARSPRRYVELGDGELPDGITHILFSTHGEGALELEPGRYEVIASRGLERGIDRACVTIVPGREELVTLAVPQELDTTGWINGDFHVHGVLSYDASVTHVDRVRSAVAEGLELLSSSDHDWISDFGPTVRAMGLENVLATMVGLETTTIESGHFIGFPLRFDPTRGEGGALDWSRRDACLLNPDAPLCRENEGSLLPMAPGEIFSALRDLGSLGPSRTAAIVPHPRDGFFGYFDQWNLDPFDLTLGNPSFLSSGNPLLRPSYWSRDFDAIEVFNGKRYELIRTPSAGEVSRFAARLSGVITTGADDAQLARVHEEAVREVLARTPEEQRALGPLRVPACRTDAECGDGTRCDPHRRECAALGATCNGMTACPTGQVCIVDARRCVLACATDDDCRQDEWCNTTTHVCTATACDGSEPPDRVCPAHQGTIDDWFRLLNAGMRVTAMGNSDTHDLHELEVGLPRNFVRVGGDTPLTIDGGEVTDSVRAGRVVASMGPFVELYVNGAPIGEMARASGASARVRVHVQTPDWFGVDRVEIYRNGELIKVYDEASGLSYDAARIDDLDAEFDDSPPPGADGAPIDTWYVAIAMATGAGRGLAPVYTSNAHPTLGFTQVAAIAFAGLDSPLLTRFLSAPIPAPEVNAVLPYAITNAVWLDANGDGRLTAPLAPPPWPDETGGAHAPLVTDANQWSPQDRIERARDLLRRYVQRAFETGAR